MLNYNAGGTTSDIDGSGSGQVHDFFWLKKAIIESRKEQYFLPLSSTTNMPKHFGKKIKVYEYVPLLDDRNINDQGIDASGATIVNGNLYGSSKDVGLITSKLPVLGENGGRVNRVGFTRLQLEGSLHKFGFFYEFTDESLSFDSDSELKDHLARESMNGAVQMTEAALQKDLLSSAGVVIYAGSATSNATVTGVANDSLVDYSDLMRLSQALTDNRASKQTKIITGSNYTDTKVIPAARVMFIGSELVPVVKGMKDQFQNPAFIAIQHYAAAGTVLNGEIGTVDDFRIVVVPEMLHWAGVGAAEGVNPGFRTSTVGGAEHYNVYPMLVVGSESFTTIGFQTNGKSGKFTVITKMPGPETAGFYDPFGERGFSSTKWYYGILVTRADHIGLIKTVAPE